MARYDENWYWQYLSPPPVQLFLFVVVVFFFLGFSWYINYESMWEDLMDQFKIFLLLFPVILLLIVHCLSSNTSDFFIPLPEQDSIHRAGGSPWGVALLLVFLLFMISYHSFLKESWWPLLA